MKQLSSIQSEYEDSSRCEDQHQKNKLSKLIMRDNTLCESSSMEEYLGSSSEVGTVEIQGGEFNKKERRLLETNIGSSKINKNPHQFTFSNPSCIACMIMDEKNHEDMSKKDHYSRIEEKQDHSEEEVSTTSEDFCISNLASRSIFKQTPPTSKNLRKNPSASSNISYDMTARTTSPSTHTEQRVSAKRLASIYKKMDVSTNQSVGIIAKLANKYEQIISNWKEFKDPKADIQHEFLDEMYDIVEQIGAKRERLVALARKHEEKSKEIENMVRRMKQTNLEAGREGRLA